MRLLLAALLLAAAGAAFATPFDDGKAAFARQDWKAAAKALARFVQESPDDSQAPAAAFLRGVALYQSGDFKGSLDAFQKLERAWPQSDYGHRLPYWKGTAALAAGRPDVAEKELAAQAQYPDEQPFATRALLNLALARLAQNKDAAASEALDAFTRASTEGALLSQAWTLWGDLDRKAGRTDAALSRYQRASAANPGDRWDLAARTWTVDLLVAASRWDEARDALEGSAARFPSETERWDPRRIVIAQGAGDRAALAAALELRWSREGDAKKKQDLALNRARTAEELGTEAASWWQRASTGPDESAGAQAALRYAFLNESGGQWIIAAAFLESWAAAHPSALAALREQVRDRAASDRLQAGDAAEARKAWDRLLADFPKSTRVPSWLLARGRLLLASGDTTRSLADFSRLLADFPRAAEAPEARYQTGLVYLQRQEPARAEGWFFGLVQDLKTGDLYQRALLARGVSFVNSGQVDLARGSLQRLLREAPDSPWVGAAWSALGRNALQARAFDEAAEALSRAEATLPSPAERAKALWSLAEARTAQGQIAAASAAYASYADSYADQPRVGEARYRQGLVWFTAKDWQKAYDVWGGVVSGLRGSSLVSVKEGMATALLRLGRPQDGWDVLAALESVVPSPESWYRWGQAATSMGSADWAVRAFQFLLQTHPDSTVAEAALPRAAGALLSGGRSVEALDRYADYFGRFGKQPASAPVARAAAAAALPFPATLAALVQASLKWNLAPEVAAEFALAWAQSRLDSDPAAQGELKDLSRTAPWTSQRSEALGILGRWQLSQGRLTDARTALEAASSLGDDLSVFRARWALAQVTEKEGDASAAARQREAAEKSAGPGVPLEFRVQVLKEAVDAWTRAGKPDEAKRVQLRISALSD